MEKKIIDDKSLVKYVEDQLKKSKKDAFELQACLNIAFFAGQQWLKVDRTQGKFYNVTLEPWQVRLVENRIQPIVRTELAKITKNKFVMYVNPATLDDKDIKAARTAEKVNEYLEYALSLQEKDRELCLWGLTSGLAFMKPFWNPTKGRAFDDGTGNVIHEGDVDCCVVSIFELKFDTSCNRWEDISWISHEKIRSIDYIKQVYGVEVEPEDNLTTSNIYEAKIQNLSSIEGVSYQKKDNSAIVHEYWELPAAEYPTGRRITTCADKVLVYEEDIGFGPQDDTERELPFFPFFHINVPGRLFPTCIVEQLIPLQRELNKSRSMIKENLNLVGNPILLSQKGNLDDTPTNEPGQVLEYNISKPEYLSPPTLGADIYRDIDYTISAFEFVSGQHETSHGTTPAGVTSGTAIGYLQEQDDTKLGPSTANYITCKQKYKKYMLKMVQKLYEEMRTLRIAGDNKKVEVMEFQGSELTSIDVRVNEATMFQTSKAASQDFILKLVQYGILLPDRERDRQLIMEVLEFGIMDNVYSEMEQDVSQASIENEKFTKGQNSLVMDFYNHDVHVKEHNKFRKSENYLNLPIEIQTMINSHVQAHMDYLVQAIEQQAKQQMMMQQPKTETTAQ